MKYLYQNKHWELNKEYAIDKLLFLMADRPDEITNYRELIWINNKNVWHRDYDLPSFVRFYHNKTCRLSWIINNRNHREKSKPTYIYADGWVSYHINGNYIKSEWLR